MINGMKRNGTFKEQMDFYRNRFKNIGLAFTYGSMFFITIWGGLK